MYALVIYYIMYVCVQYALLYIYKVGLCLGVGVPLKMHVVCNNVHS